MAGIYGYGRYIPAWRLDRREMGALLEQSRGKGSRSAASYDEDATTMAVAACQDLIERLGEGGSQPEPGMVVMATTAPPYADRTNATTVHAALRLDPTVPVWDANGATRSAVGALRLALASERPCLVVASDLRGGLPGSADEAEGGDAAAAVLVGSGDDGHVAAELIGAGSATADFVDRWREPGQPSSKLWEERFGEGQYLDVAEEAWRSALKGAGIDAGDLAAVAVSSLHPRAAASVGRRLAGGVPTVDVTRSIGRPGAAEPLLLAGGLLERASEDQVVALVSLADGADVLVLRVTRHAAALRRDRPLESAAAAGTALPYSRYLRWRNMLLSEPPRRPEPARVSSSAAARARSWKFGFAGSTDAANGEVTLPPPADGGHGDPWPMAGRAGTVATCTVDRMAWSPSPPTIFAIVDFDGGGRLPMELTDVSAGEVTVGTRVTPTFRCFGVADGIRNYFWKAKPVAG